MNQKKHSAADTDCGLILVMGGTIDARALVRELSAQGYAVLVTTATEYGAQLLDGHGQQAAQAERLDHAGLQAFIGAHGVKTLIDATHPYAEAASKTAIEVCAQINCRYVRYERQATVFEASSSDANKAINRVPDYPAAAAFVANWLMLHQQKNVLLTTGSKTLAIFVEPLRQPALQAALLARLIVRVLPTVAVLEQCASLGLQPKQIIAMQGPFSEACNCALLDQFNIGLLVSKESGEAGGVAEKLASAAACGADVVLIERPAMIYPNCYRDIASILQIL